MIDTDRLTVRRVGAELLAIVVASHAFIFVADMLVPWWASGNTEFFLWVPVFAVLYHATRGLLAGGESVWLDHLAVTTAGRAAAIVVVAAIVSIPLLLAVYVTGADLRPVLDPAGIGDGWLLTLGLVMWAAYHAAHRVVDAATRQVSNYLGRGQVRAVGGDA